MHTINYKKLMKNKKMPTFNFNKHYHHNHTLNSLLILFLPFYKMFNIGLQQRRVHNIQKMKLNFIGGIRYLNWRKRFISFGIKYIKKRRKDKILQQDQMIKIKYFVLINNRLINCKLK